MKGALRTIKGQSARIDCGGETGVRSARGIAQPNLSGPFPTWDLEPIQRSVPQNGGR